MWILFLEGHGAQLSSPVCAIYSDFPSEDYSWKGKKIEDLYNGEMLFQIIKVIIISDESW